MKYMTPLVLLVYFILGIAAIMGWKPVNHLPMVYRIGFAILCFAYIIYRGYRYRNAYFRNK